MYFPFCFFFIHRAVSSTIKFFDTRIWDRMVMPEKLFDVQLTRIGSEVLKGIGRKSLVAWGKQKERLYCA